MHTPIYLSIEYLEADLKKESAPNVCVKLNDVINCIDNLVGVNTCHEFISNSCNIMRDVHKRLVNENIFKWAYGCAAYCFHN